MEYLSVCCTAPSEESTLNKNSWVCAKCNKFFISNKRLTKKDYAKEKTQSGEISSIF